MHDNDIELQIQFNKQRQVKEKCESVYKENSKRRLLSIIDKKFQTTMIGAIVRVEEAFGELWGHGNSEPLTDEQEEFRRVWDEVRSGILDNGNKQRRAAQDEIAHYTMTWDKYKTELMVRKDR